jgi:hypothetical protein
MALIIYVNVVGNFIHVTIYTQFHMAFVANNTTQFMANLWLTHWYVIKHIFCYLQETSKYGI